MASFNGKKHEHYNGRDHGDEYDHNIHNQLIFPVVDETGIRGRSWTIMDDHGI